MTIIDVDSESDSESTSKPQPPPDHQIYSRMELLSLNSDANSLPDLENNIIKIHRDIAHVILPCHHVEENNNESKDDENEGGVAKVKLEIMSNMADLELNDQIILIVSLLKVTPRKVQKLQSVVEALEETLRKEFPNCKAHPYGSTSSGFAFEDCDLDVFIDLGLCSLGAISEVNRSDQQDRTRLMANILSREYRFRSATPIVNARTPIVKIQDRKTGIHCDVNCSCEMGVKNSEFLKFCRLYDARVDQLVSFVKLFAIKYDIIGRGPGDHLNSYTVVLLVLFFLQHENILPSVEVLQRNIEDELCCGWNFAFNEEFVMDKGNSSSVLNLLVSFFTFYINFPFKTHIICPLVGKPVKKYNLKYSYDLPDVLSMSPTFGRKKDKLELNKCLVVQDPFELTKNISSSVSERSLDHMVKVFRKGFKVLAEELPICDLFNIEDEEKEEEEVDLEDEVLEDIFSSNQLNSLETRLVSVLEEVNEVNPEEEINNNVTKLDDSIVDFVF